MAGEYGETKYRPHYHAIIFNVENPQYIADEWNHGTVDIGNVSGASCAYCAKYIDKQKRIPQHQNDDRMREFSLMSKHLGASFLTPQMIQYYNDDKTRNSLYTPQGTRIALPKYYRERLFSKETRQLQTKYIQELLETEEETNEAEYNKNNRNKDDYDYHTWKSLSRQATYTQFYKNQIKRNKHERKKSQQRDTSRRRTLH